MHPHKAAELLYKELVGKYSGLFFADAVACRGENFIVLYVDNAEKSGFRSIGRWAGFRVLLRRLSVILDFSAVCKK